MSCSYHSVSSIVAGTADNENAFALLRWVETEEGLGDRQAGEFHQSVDAISYLEGESPSGRRYWSMEKAPVDMRSLSRAAAAAAERTYMVN